ncbi:MAG TPA: phage holin family protein, partial [Polyangiaceae bacterium]|nr:phage holin family protein [Polyangiaceae bacterium]
RAMNDSLQKMQIVARAQAAILRAQLRRSVTSLVLVAIGLVFALLAVGVLNFAAYAGVEMRLGPGPAGLIVGSVDLLLAGALFAKGLAVSPPSEEEKLAREITEMATERLSAELEEARDELRDFMKSTRKMGELAHQVASIAGGSTAELIKFLSRRG